jgi:hypothetical protein
MLSPIRARCISTHRQKCHLTITSHLPIVCNFSRTLLLACLGKYSTPTRCTPRLCSSTSPAPCKCKGRHGSTPLSLRFWIHRCYLSTFGTRRSRLSYFEAFELHAGPEGSQLKHVCSDKCDFGLMAVTKVKARYAIIQGRDGQSLFSDKI